MNSDQQFKHNKEVREYLAKRQRQYRERIKQRELQQTEDSQQ